MLPAERRASASLASIFAMRMLGLFLVLPVFALEAATSRTLDLPAQVKRIQTIDFICFGRHARCDSLRLSAGARHSLDAYQQPLVLKCNRNWLAHTTVLSQVVSLLSSLHRCLRGNY
jgi:hypothetical protein